MPQYTLSQRLTLNLDTIFSSGNLFNICYYFLNINRAFIHLHYRHHTFSQHCTKISICCLPSNRRCQQFSTVNIEFIGITMILMKILIITVEIAYYIYKKSCVYFKLCIEFVMKYENKTAMWAKRRITQTLKIGNSNWSYSVDLRKYTQTNNLQCHQWTTYQSCLYWCNYDAR